MSEVKIPTREQVEAKVAELGKDRDAKLVDINNALRAARAEAKNAAAVALQETRRKLGAAAAADREEVRKQYRAAVARWNTLLRALAAEAPAEAPAPAEPAPAEPAPAAAAGAAPQEPGGEPGKRDAAADAIAAAK